MSNTSVHAFPPNMKRAYPYVMLVLLRDHALAETSSGIDFYARQKEILSEIHQWCEDQFGGPNDTRYLGNTHGNSGTWAQFDTNFYFQDETQATAFKIRWG